MAKDRDDDKQNQDYTLEEILAEYSGTPGGPDLPWPEAHRGPPPPNVVPFPGGRRTPGPEEPEVPEAEPPVPEQPPALSGPPSPTRCWSSPRTTPRPSRRVCGI